VGHRRHDDVGDFGRECVSVEVGRVASIAGWAKARFGPQAHRQRTDDPPRNEKENGGPAPACGGLVPPYGRRWPILSRFVARYFSRSRTGGAMIGTCSTISSSTPWNTA